MNKKNLELMYDYLISNREIIEPNFNMDIFRLTTSELSDHECKSQGCMLGWGVGAFPYELLPINYRGHISFWEVGKKILGIDENSELWKFLFSGIWSETTCFKYEHAMSRLKWVIDGYEIQLHPQYSVFEKKYTNTF